MKAQVSGEISDCKDCIPKIDTTIDNSLTINTRDNTYAIVKIIDNTNGKCIRYIFVNRDESYEVKNIPKGAYTIKFALGLDWDFSKKNKCKLHFNDKKPLFMKIPKPMQFRKMRKGDGYEISSFSINLGVNFSPSNVSNQKINEGDFDN